MANYKYIFKLTPNERDVVIDTSVLINGYPDVEYPIPFIPTSQLGYVIDTDTFKYIDPSIIPNIQGIYPQRLEIEVIADPEVLAFYALNNEKNFNEFIMQYDYTMTRRSHPLWASADDHNYIDFVMNIRNKAVEAANEYTLDGKKYVITFRFKLYWADNLPKDHTQMNAKALQIIPQLSIYPFVFRITPVVNQSVIDSLTSGIFDYPDIGEEPPKVHDYEPEMEDIYQHISTFYLSTNYRKDIKNVDTVLDYMRVYSHDPNLPDGHPYKEMDYNSLTVERFNYAKEYCKKKITENGLIDYKNILQHPTILVCDIKSISLKDPDRPRVKIYTSIENTDDGSGNRAWVVTPDVREEFPFWNIWMYLPDSRDRNLRDVVTFKIEATYTDPDTYLSVNALNYYTLQQRPYPGDRTGYIKMNYMDNNPLELWSPYIDVVYGKSKRDEANVKVNKNLYTEYLGFIIEDSSFNPKKETYSNYAKLYKKNILKNKFIDDGVEKEVTSENINRYIELARSDSSFYNTHVNMLDLADVSLNHYFSNFIKEDPDSVFSDYDYKNFMHRWSICASVGQLELTCIQEPKEQQLLIDKHLIDENGKYINTALDVSLNNHHVSFDGRYVAMYARYKIVNKDYRQIYGEIQTTTPTSSTINIEYIYSDDINDLYCTKDIDFSEYRIKTEPNSLFNLTNPETSIIVGYEQTGILGAPANSYNPNAIHNFLNVRKSYEYIDTENISEYKIVQTEDGNSTQYKFCINNVLYDGSVAYLNPSTINVGDRIEINYTSWPPEPSTYVDIQMPRFGVYGKYLGLFAFDFDIYNYETTDIPFIDMTEYNNNEIIITPGKSLSEINKYLHLIDPNMSPHVSGEPSTTVIPRDAMIQQQASATIFGAKRSAKRGNNLLGATAGNTTLEFYNVPEELNKYLIINGEKLPQVGTQNIQVTNNVDPYIYIIHLDDDYTVIDPFVINGKCKIGGSETYDTSLLITNGENEKHIKKYKNIGQDIDTNLDSYMVLRTNPKLTGNVKLVVDTDYNIYIDTFKASAKLNDQRYRKQAVPADGNYPYDIKRIFATLPNTELFKVPENSLKAHKVYNDFNDQFETMYEYGAETNKDNLYDENMKILAPLHIGKDVPDFFTIFRYDEELNSEAFNTVNYRDIDKLKEILAKSETVMTYDLRQYTSIGQYLNNYKDMLTNYGQCYLQFIEEDNYKQSPTYRQGTNIWKGISINRGILTNQSETTYFAEKILNSDIENKQEVFNNFIMQGFERNELLYPNIINLEFMFNDNSQDEYSMHRYFGLYLTENDFIKYGYIIPDQVDNRPMKRYDVSGNIYVGDSDIYHYIFTDDYNARLFYAVTNDNADRVKSETDVDHFLKEYVQNKPEKNMLNIKSDQIIFGENDQSFITLHFSEPLQYGEHIKFIALNKPVDLRAYNDLGIDSSLSVLPYVHIVYEIIASNNEALRYTDNYISPIETVNECRYSENTIFYRISFYSQDVNYPEVSATISDQIERIVACVKKFDSFIRVESYNKISLSIISEYDEMYVQHIAAHDFDDFTYDYYNILNNNINPSTGQINTTNSSYFDSISFIPHNEIVNINHYEQVIDEENDWIIDLENETISAGATNSSAWTCYVEANDPGNIKDDTISYFNAFEKFKMHALSNQSDYFDGYYSAFSNYGFESIGWRYNIVVKFMTVSSMKNSYNLYDDQVYNFVKKIKYPIVMTDDNMYETICLFNVDNGYLRNNVIDPDYIYGYTDVSTHQRAATLQQFIFERKEFQIISSPYNVDYSMLMSNGDALLKNNQVQLYKPKYANIAIMGISNIKDIDTIVDTVRPLENKEKLITFADSGETLKLDETDYRIQHGVVYELHKGTIIVNGTEISAVTKFMVIPDDNGSYRFLYDVYDVDSVSTTTLTADFIMAKTAIEIKIVDRQCYQVYDYTTYIPQIHVDHLFRDVNDIEHSELQYAINPLVNCNWKSNGQYYDFNNVLDVSNIRQDYEFVGNFVENVYTPALYNTNQYVTNKIDSVVFIDEEPYKFRDVILGNMIQHPIKHLLIDQTNIDTAMVYYNSNIQALEFIFSGVKFEIKLNSKIINTHIHLESYDNYEVFVINDYNTSKRNEMFISQVERFILIVNHNFYIDYAHEAHNAIKRFGDGGIKSYMDYSVLFAPYALNYRYAHDDKSMLAGFTLRKTLHDSLFKAIDIHNLWSSYFAQYDTKLLENYEESESKIFVQAQLRSLSEYGCYMTADQTEPKVPTGYNYTTWRNTDEWLMPQNKLNNSLRYYEQHPYIITKADGEYNTLAKKLLTTVNEKITKLSKNYDDIRQYKYNVIEQQIDPGTGVFGAPHQPYVDINPSAHYSDINYFDRFGLRTEFNVMTMRRITDDDINITANQNLFITYQDNNDYVMSKLSDILGTPIFMIIADEFTSNNYKNYYIPKSYLNMLQDYIEVLLVSESHQKKLERYTKSITDDMDIHIITIDNGVKHIYNTLTYNPLMFKLTIPNMIKYNQGWFTPNTINMVSFSVDDELSNALDIDLIQANTNITDINYIANYPGSKVFDDNRIYTLNKNYFFIEHKSLLDTTWDKHFYRKYTDEDNYVYKEGHITGIDDKSFFGSRCMVVRHPYILLDQWEYTTANDILVYRITDSGFNVESNNTVNTEITINITAAIYNHFINNRAFAENWNFFDDTQYTGMKNYVNNTISSYYNMNSNIEVLVYAKDINLNEPINILTIKPEDIDEYTIIEGLNVSEPDLKNDFYTITIVVPFGKGKNLYPQLKIYRK